MSQLRLGAMCGARHSGSCAACAADPYCGWDAEEGACRDAASNANSGYSYYSLLRDPSGEAPGICEGAVPARRVSVNFGQAVHLSCGNGNVEGDVSWYHFDSRGNKRRIRTDDDKEGKHLLTQDGGLVVMGATERDAGHYKCQRQMSNGGGARVTLSAHELTVDAHRCRTPGKTADYQVRKHVMQDNIVLTFRMAIARVIRYDEDENIHLFPLSVTKVQNSPPFFSASSSCSSPT